MFKPSAKKKRQDAPLGACAQGKEPANVELCVCTNSIILVTLPLARTG